MQDGERPFHAPTITPQPAHAHVWYSETANLLLIQVYDLPACSISSTEYFYLYTGICKCLVDPIWNSPTLNQSTCTCCTYNGKRSPSSESTWPMRQIFFSTNIFTFNTNNMPILSQYVIPVSILATCTCTEGLFMVSKGEEGMKPCTKRKFKLVLKLKHFILPIKAVVSTKYSNVILPLLNSVYFLPSSPLESTCISPWCTQNQEN